MHFETRDTVVPFMYIFAEPVTEEQMKDIQDSGAEKLEEFEKSILGTRRNTPPSDDWASMQTKLESQLETDEMEPEDDMVLSTHVIEQSKPMPHYNICGTLTAGPLASSEVAPPFADSTNITEEDGAGARSESRTQALDLQKDLSQQETPSPQAAIEVEHSKPEEQEIQAQAATRQSSEGGEGMPTSKPEGDEPENGKGTESAPTKEGEETENGPQSKRLLAMTLSIRNKVNGGYVTRPEALKPNDKWELEYSLAEITDSAKAWRLYPACLRRRELHMRNEVRVTEESDYFRATIRRLVNRGKEWRRQQDMIDKAKGQVVFQSMKPTFSSGDKGWQRDSQDKNAEGPEDTVERVEDYLDWLYTDGSDVKQSQHPDTETETI